MSLPGMKGCKARQHSFVSLIDVEKLIAADHSIRAIKLMYDEALATSAHFDEIYASRGTPSIPLLKGKVPSALYTVGSDRKQCARLQTDLLFRWFVDLPMDKARFDAATYSKN
jgi:transposase